MLMKTLLLTASLLLPSTPCLAADPPDSGYVAHEWGTFTSVQGSDGVVLYWNSAVTSRLPGFVYSRNHPFNDRTLDKAALMLAGKTDGLWLERMETPVIYFYSPKERSVDVKVDFPQGQVTEWFPQLAGYGPNLPLPNIPSTATNSFIEWQGVNLLPNGQSTAAPPPAPVAGQKFEYFAARHTDANLLRSPGGLGGQKKSEAEKFLFYRGVGNFSTPLEVKADATGQSLNLRNTGKAPLRELFLLTVHHGRAAFTRLDALAAGDTQTVALPSATGLRSLAETLPALGERMAQSLQSAGLYPAEARAMVETWQESWFGEDGVRVLYLLPRDWTDQILPLTLTPRPRELTRVMVGRAEILPVSLERELVRQFSRFQQPEARPGAVNTVRQMNLGRFLDPAFLRLADLLEPHVMEGKEDLTWRNISALMRAVQEVGLARN